MALKGDTRSLGYSSSDDGSQFRRSRDAKHHVGIPFLQFDNLEFTW